MNEQIEKTEGAREEPERVIDSETAATEVVSYGRASQRTRGMGFGTSIDSGGFPYPF